MVKNETPYCKIAEENYHLTSWGRGFFTVNKKGNLCVLPSLDENGPQIDIHEIIQEMETKGITLPCVIRFHDILRSQVVDLNEKFAQKIQEANYKGKYIGVYPIKVNQMREVVEEVLDAGEKYDFGLEAGSKSELLTALALNHNPKALTICNGYKDINYMKLAMLGRKLGRQVIVVIEKFSELELLLM